MHPTKVELPFQYELRNSCIFEGDATNVLMHLPSRSVQCVVTSPPYWGLRDYGVEGQIGLEPTLKQFINRIVSVFSEVRRVLKDDGTVWLNIGDGFTSGNRSYRTPDPKNPARAMSIRPETPDGLKPKDLLGIPWRVALALQEDGWYLRSDIVWNKPNANPESVKDRPTRSHEYIFMLTKSEFYYYDHEDSKEMGARGKRNRRSVWTVSTEKFPGAHFATFPVKLIDPCIRSSTKPQDFVLDPFFGAGTVGIACHQLNRRYVGIELNPDYVELAAKRLNAEEFNIVRLAS